MQREKEAEKSTLSGKKSRRERKLLKVGFLLIISVSRNQNLLFCLFVCTFVSKNDKWLIRSGLIFFCGNSHHLWEGLWTLRSNLKYFVQENFDIYNFENAPIWTKKSTYNVCLLQSTKKIGDFKIKIISLKLNLKSQLSMFLILFVISGETSRRTGDQSSVLCCKDREI